jgi:pimeloyl-ACP methyl ester carboxylesterase
MHNEYTVRGLVLISGFYFPTWRLAFLVLAAPAVPIVGDLFRYTFAPIISLAVLPRLTRLLFAPHPVPPEFQGEFPFLLAVRPKQLRAAAEESAHLVPAAARFQARYGQLTRPVRLVHGENDRLIEREQADRLNQALPGSGIEIVRGAGHMAHYADPSSIVRAVDELSRIG